MELWPPSIYKSEGQSLGVPGSVLSEALRQAHLLQRANRPAILTLKHLAVRTETRYEDLRKYVERREDPYRVFHIHKRSGGKRRICVPAAPLLRVQRWLAKYLLNEIEPHSASAAYAPGNSPVHCARFHSGCRWLIKIDVQSFFESISEIQVFHVFRNAGYNPLISFEMARLCTRAYKWSKRVGIDLWSVKNPHMRGVYQYATWQIGHLPQGAPTSPMLANLAMIGTDQDLASMADAQGLTYTRYADDLSFSTSDRSFTRAQAKSFIVAASARLRKQGLLVNKNKTVVAPPGARKIVLGLLVDGDEPRLSREFKSRLRMHVCFLKKFGPANHAHKRKFRSIWSMRRHIYGLLSYAHQVEPLFAKGVENELSSIDWGVLEEL